MHRHDVRPIRTPPHAMDAVPVMSRAIVDPKARLGSATGKPIHIASRVGHRP